MRDVKHFFDASERLIFWKILGHFQASYVNFCVEKTKYIERIPSTRIPKTVFKGRAQFQQSSERRRAS